MHITRQGRQFQARLQKHRPIARDILRCAYAVVNSNGNAMHGGRRQETSEPRPYRSPARITHIGPVRK